MPVPNFEAAKIDPAASRILAPLVDNYRPCDLPEENDTSSGPIGSWRSWTWNPPHYQLSVRLYANGRVIIVISMRRGGEVSNPLWHWDSDRHIPLLDRSAEEMEFAQRYPFVAEGTVDPDLMLQLAQWAKEVEDA